MTMKRTAAIALALVVGSSASTVYAQDTVIQQEDKTVYKKKTVIDFTDLSIEGELTKPQGSYLLNRRKTGFTSLLKYRQNFLPELRNSVDNL